MFTTYYNEAIRKTVVAFGSLFDEIFVQRRDSAGNTIKKFMVPISYSLKKIYSMLDEYPNTKGQVDGNVAANQQEPVSRQFYLDGLSSK